MMRTRWLLALLAATLLSVAGPTRAAPVLVDAAWLEKHLDDPSIVLVDMTSDPMQYRRFHLPGALHLPYGALVEQHRDGVVRRIDDKRLSEVLGVFGISADKHVVIYDDMGGLNAGRLFWELERIGHPAVSVLEGGLVDWVLSGRKVTTNATEPQEVKYVPTGRSRANQIDYAAFRAAAADGKTAILDVRTRQEYAGHPREPRSGHVPGARWWPWDETVDFDNRFKPKPVPGLMESLHKVGAADKQQQVITYCRSGQRAAQAYLTLRALGYEDVRLYAGSMLEYERDRNAPLNKGMIP
jgi:thiosulfate/3-mercaptopyruvate sulfurtransferase